MTAPPSRDRFLVEEMIRHLSVIAELAKVGKESLEASAPQRYALEHACEQADVEPDQRVIGMAPDQTVGRPGGCKLERHADRPGERAPPDLRPERRLAALPEPNATDRDQDHTDPGEQE